MVEMHVRQNLVQTIVGLRIGAEAAGYRDLLVVIDALKDGKIRFSMSTEALLPIFEQLVSAQLQGDSLRLADVLEFELLPRVVDE